ncbi:MAG: hypothetical protein ACM3WV_09485 [Bacillota bacterium]
MKCARICLPILLALLLLNGAVFALNTAQQTVTYEVQEINEIGVSGNPGALIINTAVPGSPPTSAVDSSTTYSISTNAANKRITASIDTAMPANTTLNLSVVAPTGGTATAINLTTVDQNLVTGISTLAETGLTITYTFSATAAAGVIPSAQKIVTLTLTT